MLRKKIIILCSAIFFLSCDELQNVVSSLPNEGTGISDSIIGNGLREALDFGIDKQVTKLTQKDGFFKNELVKILLPEELRKVDKTLRDVGLSSLADEGLKVLNRAAEDAVGEATPIFVDAVKGITFTDAKNILLGNDNSATNYLKGSTNQALYNKFNPVIQNSFSKWAPIKYGATLSKNTIPSLL